jgi:type II secretory pathway component PulF
MSRGFVVSLVVLAVTAVFVVLAGHGVSYGSLAVTVLVTIAALGLLLGLRSLLAQPFFAPARFFLFPGERAYVADLCQFIANAIRAGVDPAEALTHRLDDLGPYWFRRRMQRFARRVSLGEPFSVAAVYFGEVFGRAERGIIAAGEKSGRLAEAFEFLAGMERARGMHNLPVFLLVLDLVWVPVVMLFIMATIMPKFADIYSQLGVELPLYTRWFIGAGGGVMRWLFAIVTLALFATILILGFRHNGQFWRSVFAVAPWLRERFLAPHVSRFSFSLGSLLGAGFELPLSLRMAVEASRHPVLIDDEPAMQGRLEAGQQIGAVIATQPGFPPRFQWLAARAFASGRPEPALMRLAEDYRSAHERLMRRLGAVVLPVLVLLLGAWVGFFALAVYLPLFSLAKVMGGE